MRKPFILGAAVVIVLGAIWLWQNNPTADTAREYSSADIAGLVASKPTETVELKMAHCHIAEHLEAGMMLRFKGY